MGSPLTNVRTILVRPKIAANVGAVARVLANTGMSQLIIIAPECDPTSREARRPSARAEPILLAARCVETLGRALEGVSYALGTSCRGGHYRDDLEVSPDAGAAEVLSCARHGPVAVLFGPEDDGLTNAEILSCDAVMRIPTDPGYPSLNLAQAVMVVAYELFLAAAKPPAAQPPRRSIDELADAAAIDRLITKYREGLLKIGYLSPENPEHLLFPLRAVIARSQPTVKEVQILLGMAQQISTFADEHVGRAAQRGSIRTHSGHRP